MTYNTLIRLYDLFGRDKVAVYSFSVFLLSCHLNSYLRHRYCIKVFLFLFYNSTNKHICQNGQLFLVFNYVNIFVFAATELVDEPVPADGRLEQDCSGNETVDPLAREQRPEGQLHSEGLLPELEALTCRMTPLELNCYSAEQLVQMHDWLGGMMRRVVVELQTRVCQTDGKPWSDFCSIKQLYRQFTDIQRQMYSSGIWNMDALIFFYPAMLCVDRSLKWQHFYKGGFYAFNSECCDLVLPLIFLSVF